MYTHVKSIVANDAINNATCTGWKEVLEVARHRPHRILLGDRVDSNLVPGTSGEETVNCGRCKNVSMYVVNRRFKTSLCIVSNFYIFNVYILRCSMNQYPNGTSWW